jgi:hypothetical protein
MLSRYGWAADRHAEIPTGSQSDANANEQESLMKFHMTNFAQRRIARDWDPLLVIAGLIIAQEERVDAYIQNS